MEGHGDGGKNEMGGKIIFQCFSIHSQNICVPQKNFAFAFKNFCLHLQELSRNSLINFCVHSQDFGITLINFPFACKTSVMEIMTVFFLMCISITGLLFFSDDMQICTYSKHIQNFVCFYHQYKDPVVFKCGIINPTLLRSATDICSFLLSFLSLTFCLISINLTLSFSTVPLYCFLNVNMKCDAPRLHACRKRVV